MNLLELRDVAVHYGSVEAVKGVSFSVEAGKIVALVGANGAGKSSILRAISRLTPASRGEILFEGQPLAQLRADRVAALGVGHAPEGRGIFPRLTVEENLNLGAYLRRDKAEIRGDFEAGLALFPRLRERLKQPAGTLSGGEQQMLAIARALMSRPKLLLLDEPSLGLAPQMIERIFESIVKVNKSGTAVLLVEQNALMALEAAHYALVLETGKIVVQGPSRELLSSPEVRKAYLGE